MDRDQKCSSSFFIFKHVNEQDVLIPYRIAKVDNLKLTVGRRVRLKYPPLKYPLIKSQISSLVFTNFQIPHARVGSKSGQAP